MESCSEASSVSLELAVVRGSTAPLRWWSGDNEQGRESLRGRGKSRMIVSERDREMEIERGERGDTVGGGRVMPAAGVGQRTERRGRAAQGRWKWQPPVGCVCVFGWGREEGRVIYLFIGFSFIYLLILEFLLGLILGILIDFEFQFVRIS